MDATKINLLKSKSFFKKAITFTKSLASSPEKKQPMSKYTSLVRSDFDMKIIDKWMEVRCKNSPKRRCLHMSFVYNSYFYIYGGISITEGKIMDLWRISISNFENPTWEIVKTNGALPEDLAGQSGVIVGNKFYMFGGENNKQDPVNDLYILDLDIMKWEKRMFTEEEVPYLYANTLNYYLKSNSLIIFGGFIKGEYKNNIYLFQIDKNEWTTINYSNIDFNYLPPGRINHASVIAKDSLYVYAGQNSDGNNLNDLWKFDLINRKWEMIKYANQNENDIPSARSGHSMVYHLITNSLFIFAGKFSNIQERNDLWKFDLSDNKFTLLHDTLIETYRDDTEDITQFNNSYNTSPLKKLKTMKSMSFAFDLETQKNLVNTKYPSIKIQKRTILGESNKKSKQNYEEMVLENRVINKLSNTMIYKMELADSNGLRQRVNTLLTKNFFSMDRFKSGSIPAPRDGHTALINENMMIVFGGDRNKYPYNDMFIFNIV